MTAAPPPAPVTSAVFAGEASEGLTLLTGGDVDTEIVEATDPPEQAWRSGAGAVLPSPNGNTDADWYIQSDVDDGIIHQGSPTSSVDLYFQADDLAQMVIEVQEHAYQAIIHGLGDRAVEANLDAIEKAKAVCPADDDHGCRHPRAGWRRPRRWSSVGALPRR